jgi:hypothetical protein
MRHFLPKAKPDVRIRWSANPNATTPLSWNTGDDTIGYGPSDLTGDRAFGIDNAVYSVDRNSLVTFFAVTNFKSTGSFPVAWEWSFGDGAEGYGESVTHAYSTVSTEGVQAVVTVTDNRGRKWRARKQMYINQTAVRPMILATEDMVILEAA